MWAGRVLLLFLCLMKENSDGMELTFVRFIERVRLLPRVSEALKFVWVMAERTYFPEGSE